VFYLLPDDGQVTGWPMSIPYLVEPVPLCDLHGGLIGEGKLVQPTRPMFQQTGTIRGRNAF
jgi:hypothetical protein